MKTYETLVIVETAVQESSSRKFDQNKHLTSGVTVRCIRKFMAQPQHWSSFEEVATSGIKIMISKSEYILWVNARSATGIERVK